MVPAIASSDVNSLLSEIIFPADLSVEITLFVSYSTDAVGAGDPPS